MNTFAHIGELEPSKRTIKFFEGLLRSTPNGVVVTDASQNIALVNGAFSSIFTRHWRDIIETSLFVWLQQFDDDAVDIWIKMVESVYRDGQCFGVNFEITTNEKTRYLSVNASLVEGVSIEEQGVIISIWSDITEQRQMEEQIVSSERLAVLGKLSGSIAHEIRNPLATIDISALNLKRKLKDADDKTKSQIDRIIKQVKETTDTVQSLQDLAKLEAPVKSRVDIVDIIDDGISISDLPESIQLFKEMANDKLFVDIDKKQISIVLRNILSNSLHAMKNTGFIRITAFREKNGNVNISIEDSGHGISQENMGKIFKSFFGTKTKGFVMDLLYAG